MEEHGNPRKSKILYWLIALGILLLLQIFVFPQLFSVQETEVTYDTFISMTENKEIDQVSVGTSEITFTDKDGNYYTTTVMDDDGLIDRLYESGAEFAAELESTGTSTLLYIIVSYILPIVLIVVIFRIFSKRMHENMGGGSMAFGMGKSNAKVYVKSTSGIKFEDVAGEEEAKDL